MDQLTLDCIAARKAGMTYGKWKALQPRIEVVMPKQEEKKPKPEVREPMPIRECKHCGKEFATDNGAKRYCCYECYYDAGQIRNKENYWRKKERMMADGMV